MTTRVLNFLWLNLGLVDPDLSLDIFHLPMPQEYIANVCWVGESNPDVDVHLWIDSLRMTHQQLSYLKDAISKNTSDNVKVKDLRNIDEYNEQHLFYQSQDFANFRKSKHGVIWRQVDVAKILICLQEDYDQTFYADIDHAIFEIKSDEVQTKLKDYGLVFEGIFSLSGRVKVENQLWGFSRDRRNFFESLCQKTLTASEVKGVNGYQALNQQVNELGTDGQKVLIIVRDQLTEAYHPEFVFQSEPRALVRRKATHVKWDAPLDELAEILRDMRLSGGPVYR